MKRRKMMLMVEMNRMMKMRDYYVFTPFLLLLFITSNIFVT